MLRIAVTPRDSNKESHKLLFSGDCVLRSLKSEKNIKKFGNHKISSFVIKKP